MNHLVETHVLERKEATKKKRKPPTTTTNMGDNRDVVTYR